MRICLLLFQSAEPISLRETNGSNNAPGRWPSRLSSFF